MWNGGCPLNKGTCFGSCCATAGKRRSGYSGVPSLFSEKRPLRALDKSTCFGSCYATARGRKTEKVVSESGV